MASVKAYQLALNQDKARLLNQIDHFEPTTLITKESRANTILTWQEDVRSADRWLIGSKSKVATYSLPITIQINENGFIEESSANLTDIFKLMSNNTEFLGALGRYSFLLQSPINVESLSKHSDPTTNDYIGPDYFRFISDAGSVEVKKLEFPRPAESSTKEIYGILPEAFRQLISL